MRPPAARARARLVTGGPRSIPVVGAERRRDRSCEAVAKTTRRSKKTRFFFIIHCSFSGCVRREIPGVTQVDEKGHEGNTAVAKTFNIFVGGNMVKETARRGGDRCVYNSATAALVRTPVQQKTFFFKQTGGFEITPKKSQKK